MLCLRSLRFFTFLGLITASGSSFAQDLEPNLAPQAAPHANPAATAPRSKLSAYDPNGDLVLPTKHGDYLEAGFGRGITLHAEKGDTHLQIRGRIQPRYSFTDENGSQAVNEFIIRRARLAFMGRFLDSWELYLQLGFSNQDNESDYYNPLRDATITYAGLRDLNVRVGQMKVPFDRQRMNSSSALEFADRSLVVSELTLDRDSGIQLLSEDLAGLDGMLGYNLGVFGGDGRNRRANNPGVMLVGRVTAQPFGDFDANVEADLKRDPKFRMALGVAAARNYMSVRSRSTSADTYDFATFNYTHLTADLTLKWRGLFVLGELLYRKADEFSQTQTVNDITTTEFSRSGWGFFTQAGYMWTKHFETVARYGELYPFAGTDPSLSRQRELGAAINYYFMGHDLKVVADYFYLDSPDSRSDTQTIRLQTQLYF